MPCSNRNVNLLKRLYSEVEKHFDFQECKTAVWPCWGWIVHVLAGEPLRTLYVMGSHTGCSERHPYKHYWICRKNKLVRIVLREMLGKVWHILLSSWADPTAVTPRCHCLQGCCWDLCSCSSLWGMGHSSAASSSLRERSWQFLTQLYCKVFLLAPQSPLRENNHCKVYVSTPSCIVLRENMVRLGPSEVLFPVVS